MTAARTLADDTVPTIKYGSAELYELPLNQIWQYAAERQRLYHVWKEGRPATNDPELAIGKYCNVFRYLDRASVRPLAI